MLLDKKIVIVLPAYNAEKTLAEMYSDIPMDIIDDIVLVDDSSKDKTVDVAKKLGIKHIIIHEKNKGYGNNQKTCYHKALEIGADIIIMLHPDYQYTPKLIPAMANIIAYNVYPVVLGSRILGKGARTGGMPFYKYYLNRILTLFQNLVIDQKLSEYHTGYRAFSKEVLNRINFDANSNDFIFDNEMISQVFFAGFQVAEITCPTKYFKEASSINFRRSVKYGFGVLRVSIQHFLQKHKLANFRIYKKN
ncbi:MAG: glycosyltransferase family 2 protein [Ignavibacteriae bacterium]|nr:MAG: glycosyltransferase family 2 protein [Ignavibacteriota bacterium]